MRKCIIHFGAPKTGSTAIQNAFFYGVRDPGFQYFSGGYFANGVFLTQALFEDPPLNQSLYHQMGAPRGSFSAYRNRLQTRLDRTLTRARHRQADVIISSEHVWVASERALRRMRQCFEGYGYEVVLAGYIRPYESWIPSLFQEAVKFGHAEFRLPTTRNFLEEDVRGIAMRLFSAFGRRNVSFHLFDPGGFPAGCVVRHFCESIGFAAPSSYSLRRVNESLSLPAVQFLYAYNMLRSSLPETGLPLTYEYELIFRRLAALPGPPFALHPSVIEEWIPDIREQEQWVGRELGIAFNQPRSPKTADAADVASNVVSSAAEMLDFSRESLDWLSSLAHGPRIQPSSGVAAAASVAQYVRGLLSRHERLRALPGKVLRRLHTRIAHWRFGC